jgi:hypothetical protein
MKRLTLSKFIIASVLITLFSCSEATEAIKTEVTPTTEAKEEPKTETKEIVEAIVPTENVTPTNGVYTNNEGGLVTISNVSAEGFDFKFTHADPKIDEFPDCTAIDYKASVTFDKDNQTTATNDIEDLFKFNQGGFHFEPSMEMIGMDCMRIFNLEFVKEK